MYARSLAFLPLKIELILIIIVGVAVVIMPPAWFLKFPLCLSFASGDWNSIPAACNSSALLPFHRSLVQNQAADSDFEDGLLA